MLQALQTRTQFQIEVSSALGWALSWIHLCQSSQTLQQAEMIFPFCRWENQGNLLKVTWLIKVRARIPQLSDPNLGLKSQKPCIPLSSPLPPYNDFANSKSKQAENASARPLHATYQRTRLLPPRDTCVNTAGEHCWPGTPRNSSCCSSASQWCQGGP